MTGDQQLFFFANFPLFGLGAEDTCLPPQDGSDFASNADRSVPYVVAWR